MHPSIQGKNIGVIIQNPLPDDYDGHAITVSDRDAGLTEEIRKALRERKPLFMVVRMGADAEIDANLGTRVDPDPKSGWSGC